MNKITVLSTILTALLMLTIPIGQVEASPKPTPTVVIVNQTDLRVKALERMFEKHNSPLAPYAQDYIDVADKYGVDWKLLPAISGLESSFGIHQLSGSYNSYGWGGGRIYFRSVEEGIETVLSGLKNRYIARGATTVEAIAPIYSESPTWAPRIRHFMNEIDAEYAHLGTHQLALTI